MQNFQNASGRRITLFKSDRDSCVKRVSLYVRMKRDKRRRKKTETAIERQLMKMRRTNEKVKYLVEAVPEIRDAIRGWSVSVGRLFLVSSCENRCFSGRVTELASTRPLYIRDRDWVGGVGGGNAGGGKPTPSHSFDDHAFHRRFDDISTPVQQLFEAPSHRTPTCPPRHPSVPHPSLFTVPGYTD